MNTIYVISKIRATHLGPECQCGKSEDWNRVFFEQGTLDGACGHYCALMSLVINGVVSPEEVILAMSNPQDARTNIGKVVDRIKKRRREFFHGTRDKDIESILKGIYRKSIRLTSARSQRK